MPEFPQLSFLPVEDMLIHERHDSERTKPLVLRIRASGVFRHPPIVSPLPDGSGRYMVLDGANRITALREMGCPHALVQVVPPNDPGLILQTWNHVVWEMNARRFFCGIRDIPGLHLVRVTDPHTEPSLARSCGLVLVQTCKGHGYSACVQTDSLEERVHLLNAIVDSYVERARLDRTNAREARPLREIYPLLCGLVIFPTFQIYELMRLASQGLLLPTGITRFLISPRALHLNYPLSELTADKPLAEKNAILQRWLQDRIARKGVRYYAEATVLFDE